MGTAVADASVHTPVAAGPAAWSSIVAHTAGVVAPLRGYAKVACLPVETFPPVEKGARMADGATPAGVDPPFGVSAGAAAGDGGYDADVVDIAAPRPIEFEEFVRIETAGLLRSAYLLTGNSPSAEDVVQETLTRLYPKWERVQSAAYPKAYVHRSLVNTFLNTRRTKSSQEIVVDDIGDRPATFDLAEQVGESDLVWGLLTRLGERQRTALVLRYFHDWTDHDIARAIGCRTGTVRSLISRGLATLRTDLRADTEAGYADGGRT